MNLAAHYVNGKQEWVKPRKEMPLGVYITVLAVGETWGPFASIEEAQEWHRQHTQK
jgi:hypothetical protein